MYQLHNPTGMPETKVVRRLSDGTYIPFDPGNIDYQQYLKWLEEGNTPLPVEPPSPPEI